MANLTLQQISSVAFTAPSEDLWPLALLAQASAAKTEEFSVPGFAPRTRIRYGLAFDSAFQAASLLWQAGFQKVPGFACTWIRPSPLGAGYAGIEATVFLGSEP